MDDGQLPLFPKPRRHSREEAIEATNDGIERAIEHAEQVEPGWKERAYEFLLLFASFRSCFRCEEAREWAEDCGLPYPPDKRAWGAVIRRAALAGVIAREGYDKSRDPKVHRTLTTLWRACKGKLNG